ncbi:MAG: ABC transporter substrate-binding protein [Chloroflexi bacterium]|nr:ABC transporter substrate-binding protein [Chloroflexota bacterium]
MQRRLIVLKLLVLVMSTASFTLAQDAAELRFLCYQDGNECEVYAELLDRFSADTGIVIHVEIVAADKIDAELSRRLAEGTSPDFARVSDLATLAGHTLDLRPLLTNADELEAQIPAPVLSALRDGHEDDGIYALPDALAVVAPFVNLSSFEQAGIAIPGGGDQSAGWDEWLAALDLVLAETAVPYALAVDNKEHRLVGPAMSLGARYFDESGDLRLVDDSGLREFLRILQRLMEADKTPADTLLGTGKSQDYFVRGETVLYICGSWKVLSVAQAVDNAFEWAILPNPGGVGGSAGIAQVTSLVAFEGSPHTEALGMVFDYLTQPAVIGAFSAQTLTVPALLTAAGAEVNYVTEIPAIAAALNAFAREVPRLQDQAVALDLHPEAAVYYEASNQYLRAFFAGELGLDEALAGIEQALAN